MGGEIGVATGKEGLAGDFGDVAIEGEPTSLAREPKGDFDNGELGPLGNVAAENKSDASFGQLKALAFFFDPLGIGGEGSFVAFVATEEATGWVAGGGVSLFACLDVVTVALGTLSDLFMEEALPRVRTVLLVWEKEKNKQRKNKEKEEDEG